MCHKNTVRGKAISWTVLGLCVLSFAATLWAQPPSAPGATGWRHIGNAAVDISMPSLATGPADRVWYSAGGDRLFVKTRSGRLFETSDFETWIPAAENAPPPPPDESALVSASPEPGQAVKARRQTSHLYAIGSYVYRSEDGGENWANLTRYRNVSILGAGLTDLAISPRDPDELAVASRTGVWRSVDGGLSWAGLNQALPNLPVNRILSLPVGTRGVRIAAGAFPELEWTPGEKQAWRATGGAELAQETELRASLSGTLRATITAVAVAADSVYAGASDGRIWVSSDRGRSWVDFRLPDSGAVERFWIDPKDSRVALAALGTRPSTSPLGTHAPHVIRTLNAGTFWDDLTANLPDAAVHGVTADPSSGALYVATEVGVFASSTDLTALAPPAPWASLSDTLPVSVSTDIRLDPEGNWLYVALDGFGVFETIAPHRFRDPRVVSAADYRTRAAAPGSLLSVVGTNVDTARAGGVTAPVLAHSPSESQIQVPFEARGGTVSLALEGAGGSRLTVPIPIESAAPAVFVDRDGAPMLVEAQTGMLLDGASPAHAGSRIQILATGLGRVNPDWPTGVAAPDNPPAVAAPVSVFLDRQPVEVLRAVLAPHYIGFYLIEVQLPKIVNYGPSELYLTADGHESNRVLITIEP